MRAEILGLFMLLGFTVTHAASAQEAKILAFGDSISIGFREPDVDCDRPTATARGYAEHLVDLLADDGWTLEWDAFGVCGELTVQGLSRLDDVLAAQAGEVVLIMEGTNDMSRGGSNLISLETVQDNLERMVAKARQAGRTPVLASTIPYGPGADRQASLNTRAERLSERLGEWALSAGVPFVDAYGHLVAMPDIFTRYFHSDGYHLTAGGNEKLADAFEPATLTALESLCRPSPCQANGDTLCLADDRFEVKVEWRVGDTTGMGTVEPLPGGESGKIWFFSPQNLELVVKVLDGRCASGPDAEDGAFWFFYGALSDIEYRIDVLDTETCRSKTYLNPAGTSASVGDTSAFPEACPTPGV